MSVKEAKARIKINKLLEAAGWRFFDDDNGVANIQVEANVKITKKQFDDLHSALIHYYRELTQDEYQLFDDPYIVEKYKGKADELNSG